MPCHSDRVRRSYHEGTITEVIDPRTDEGEFKVRITRECVASAMSAREVMEWIGRRFREETARAFGR